ncbi:sialate O-acetylesterase [Allosphingosinicella deserti]|nr:sialate O-acetylesterase [Sphingomonas deserti]
MIRRLASLLLAGAAMPAAVLAAPVLDPVFSDHAVLQRDKPILLWGRADPGEKVTVTIGSARGTATADRSGAWRAELPKMAAGGPYTLSAAGKGTTASASDILIGDVWLCSGQSNMEYPLERTLASGTEIANGEDPQLRLMTVSRRTALAPMAQFGNPIGWSVATKQSLPGFSAACFFMAKDLRASENVPIGAIHSSWGGTQIAPWIDLESAQPFEKSNAGLLALFQRDPLEANRRFGERWTSWWTERVGNAPWRDSSLLSWKPMPSVSYWESWGDTALRNHDGLVWARRKVALTAEEAKKGAVLSLGVVDDADQTFVNGVAIGNSFGWNLKRRYELPARLLKAGENEILIAISDSWGFGGFQGPAELLSLAIQGGETKALGSDWDYALSPAGVVDPPRPPWDSNAGASLIYNAMIAPLGPLGLKGAAWYQGESDVANNKPYADKLGALMASWRKQFRDPQLPFLVVSLANYGPPQPTPRASGWAELREQQRVGVERDRHAALVVAMDLGERQDIHPANKQEVGRRLARAARNVAYGKPEPVGPAAAAAERGANGILVVFTGVTGRLVPWSGTRALAFELCGDTQESCRFAEAVPEGANVRITDDGKPATRVRYGWADTPITNLYDEASLPPGPFELPIR